MDKNKKAEELFSAITDIDEKYIEEADLTKASNIKTVYPGKKRWVAIAACFILLVVAMIPLGSSLLSKSTVKYNDFTDNASADNSAFEAVPELKNEKAYGFNSNESSVEELKLTAVVVSTDFELDFPVIKVVWSNPTDEDKKVSSKFVVVRIDGADTIVPIIHGDTKVAFADVLYTVPANGEYTMEYQIDRGVYDISKPGHYRIYFDTTEAVAYNEDVNCFDFQVS